METPYFDSSVFIAVFKGEDSNQEIRELFKELQRQKVHTSTSIITIQEVSVLSYRFGTVAKDNYARVHELARIEGVDKDISLTAAKLEAQLLDTFSSLDEHEKQLENKRRKWDCFHIATAICVGCNVLYSLDERMLSRKQQLKIRGLDFRPPGIGSGTQLSLRYGTTRTDKTSQSVVTGPTAAQGNSVGPTEGQAGPGKQRESLRMSPKSAGQSRDAT
jgi:Predicted nucleic acid-binding protein, contains PIN domain